MSAAWRMIRKSVQRFSEKIMRNKSPYGRFNSVTRNGSSVSIVSGDCL
jgi:hypothetical protein